MKTEIIYDDLDPDFERKVKVYKILPPACHSEDNVRCHKNCILF